MLTMADLLVSKVRIDPCSRGGLTNATDLQSRGGLINSSVILMPQICRAGGGGLINASVLTLCFGFCLLEVRAMVVAVQQPSAEYTAIFTLCIV